MAFTAAFEDSGSPGPTAARLKAFRAARRHSRNVRVLRLLLPAAGVLAVAGLFALTRLGLPIPVNLSSAGLNITSEAVIMEQPRLTGFDGDNREYAVSAARAIQPLATANRLNLEEIEATITVVGQGVTTIRSGSGLYDHSARTLRLEDGITVNNVGGYALSLIDADIDFGAGTMRSDKRVTVTYADSEVTAERFLATENGKHLIFDGSVRTTVLPPKRPGASAEPEETPAE